MDKKILTKDQVFELIEANKYIIDGKNKFLSRCIDGRYSNENNLPPLAIAGADAGELALLFAASNTYGFEIDPDKTFQSLIEIIGGIKNLQFHTDHHAKQGLIVGGCGHIKQMTLDPQAYNITNEQIKFIKDKLTEAKNKGAQETILEGDHIEGAVLLVTGDYSIKTRYYLGDALLEVFVHHQELIDKRHRILVKKLIKNKAIKLLKGLDEEYLYQVLVGQTEDHLMETAKRLAKGLPIFMVKFESDGSFKLTELGKV